MKLLLVSINFSLVIVELVIQEIQLKWINTIVGTLSRVTSEDSFPVHSNQMLA